ncbi:hypothetical protein R1sor_000531 [Riccia sorocarpa]|uniref:Uncharacterized protein n=1 Tax=Riccia sorocarpa TaxID=122646 RepID=A0ABD3GXC2_9MARC
MATLARNASTRSTSSLNSNSSLKDNRPAWYGGCSPGRPNTLFRSNSGRPSMDQRGMGVSKQVGVSRVEKPAVKKNNPSPLRSVSSGASGKNLRPASPRVSKPASPRLRPASPRVTASGIGKEDSKREPSLEPSKVKVAKVPVKNETPPPSRPKKPASSFVTPPSKGSRKPLATIGTPTNQGPEKRIRTLEETPTRKVKERPSIAGVSQDSATKGTAKDKAQPFSAWTLSSVKARRGSTPGKGTTPNKAPVKSMFLSPQASKKNNVVKKEPLRKSAENHGIWVGQVPSRKRAAEKRENPDSGMPPPAQPTSSPEIPKRGSRELSGEGLRGGYFGAGPMVAPEGCGGFVRDRRKCKPRGTLVVDQALSVDSDSSGAVESSIQMPLPSVASVEWMDRIRTSSTTGLGYFNDLNQSHGGSKILSGEDFRPNVKQARISGGEKRHYEIRQSRQTVDNCHQVKSSSQDLYGDSIYHHLTQARGSGGESAHEVMHQSGQNETGFYRPRSSQDVFGESFYQQLKYARSSGGEAYNQVRHSRQKSGDGCFQVVRSSQVFLQQLRQSQISSKDGTNQLNSTSVHSAQTEDITMQNSLHSGTTSQNLVFKEGIIQNSLYTETGTIGKSGSNGVQVLSESGGYGDVTIDWRDGLPDSEASSAKHSPDELVAGSVSFGTSWVPPAQERRMSSGAKTWLAPDSTWYGFSPMTPEFQRSSQLQDTSSKLIEALVAAGSVRRRIMTDQSSSYENADLENISLVQSLQALNVDASVNTSSQSQSRTSQSRFSRSRCSRSSQDTGALPFSFTSNRSYANIAELEQAEQNLETQDSYMCLTASPIDPLQGDDVICEGAFSEDMACQAASSAFGGGLNRESNSPLLSDDVICQTASPLNEVGSAPTPPMIEDNNSRWDDGSESDGGVEYASPVAGDYLSPVKAASRGSPGRSMLDMGESNRGVRASRRASISKTLEELLRHNLHL